MNKSNLKTVLTSIRDMIMRNRVAYKDYLGEETVEETEEIASGVFNDRSTSLSTSLVEGETYIVSINGVKQEMIAQDTSMLMFPIK